MPPVSANFPKPFVLALIVWSIVPSFFCYGNAKANPDLPKDNARAFAKCMREKFATVEVRSFRESIKLIGPQEGTIMKIAPPGWIIRDVSLKRVSMNGSYSYDNPPVFLSDEKHRLLAVLSRVKPLPDAENIGLVLDGSLVRIISTETLTLWAKQCQEPASKQEAIEQVQH